jgi:hypothetical protein
MILFFVLGSEPICSVDLIIDYDFTFNAIHDYLTIKNCLGIELFGKMCSILCSTFSLDTATYN